MVYEKHSKSSDSKHIKEEAGHGRRQGERVRSWRAMQYITGKWDDFIGSMVPLKDSKASK